MPRRAERTDRPRAQTTVRLSAIFPTRAPACAQEVAIDLLYAPIEIDAGGGSAVGGSPPNRSYRIQTLPGDEVLDAQSREAPWVRRTCQVWENDGSEKGGATGAQAQGVDSGGRKNGQTRQDYYFFGLLLMSSRCAPSAPFQHIRAYIPVSSKTVGYAASWNPVTASPNAAGSHSGVQTTWDLP
ncbi:hypothetical protein EVAR_76928_1 [Eumeta japonica]|uniref:Uncharacterized protein n=1 Tax=Eumeta variegata TaxID=151549 RepID=A0A4C1SH16_EUMVA|nr:hypothetical protein EVAR_76928_1 [Eumeta japonica]